MKGNFGSHAANFTDFYSSVWGTFPYSTQNQSSHKPLMSLIFNPYKISHSEVSYCTNNQRRT